MAFKNSKQQCLALPRRTRAASGRRCGVLMAARALKTGGNTGLVVTASHNPEADNGVKLVDPSGYMLEQAWEVHRTEDLAPTPQPLKP